MSFTVVYDANVLYPESLRDLLVRMGQTHLVRARWTEQIMNEWSRALVKRRPDLETRIQGTVRLMNESFRSALVTGYKALIPHLTLPDPDDRHVLAAAIRSGAQAIVTFNLAHFPEQELKPYRLKALHPDELIAGLMGQGLVSIVQEMASEKQRPPVTPLEVVASLRWAGLRRSADLLIARLRATSGSPPR
ncbi:MAG TPA: PIN domain-containing protein [Myxococcaceae bacterium]|nr:PIN domain-containing protein [Myxococcaceae bacterium]